jgi:hypothetical protein
VNFSVCEWRSAHGFRGRQSLFDRPTAIIDTRF